MEREHTQAFQVGRTVVSFTVRDTNAFGAASTTHFQQFTSSFQNAAYLDAQLKQGGGGGAPLLFAPGRPRFSPTSALADFEEADDVPDQESSYREPAPYDLALQNSLQHFSQQQVYSNPEDNLVEDRDESDEDQEMEEEGDV